MSPLPRLLAALLLATLVAASASRAELRSGLDADAIRRDLASVVPEEMARR